MQGDAYKKPETAVLGGGCFWCVEAAFQNLKGVSSVESGYAGGEKETAIYEKVSTGNTGHAEVVKVIFDPNIITFNDLVEIFFSAHDPTTLNRQGNDIGSQYRSVIFYVDENQKIIAQNIIKELEKEKIFDKPIVTEVSSLKGFYPAEEIHQKYFERNNRAPYCEIVINPKLMKLKEKYRRFYK